MKRAHSLAAMAVGLLLACSTAAGADWPMFRCDAGRTAATEEALAETLHLQWSRDFPSPRPAFPGEVRLRYDATYEPVVVGATIYAPSMVTDSVTAFDTATGKERWRFFVEGPVRFAPAVGQGKVYAVSDDGYLYCLNASNGKLVWSFRGAPKGKTDRKVIGDGRLGTLFPARGGPLLVDDVVYFAAGIWSGEGVFVHALNAKTGKPVWSNTDSDRIEAANMDHGVAYYAGISPQGYLAMVDGKLVVPCGAQLPALFDPKTGKIGKYTMGWGGRIGLAKGSWFVAGVGKYLVHGGDLYDISLPNEEKLRNPRGGSDYKKMLYVGGMTRLQIDRTNQKALGAFRRPVLTADAMYYSDRGIMACDLAKGSVAERTGPNNPEYRRKDQYPDRLMGVFPVQWRVDSPSMVHIKAGYRLYCGAEGRVDVVDIPKAGGKPEARLLAEVEGTPHSMVAANGRLFVVTRQGRLYAFGEKKAAKPVAHRLPSVGKRRSDRWTAAAARMVELSDTRVGYTLVLGAGSGRLAEELAAQSHSPVFVIDRDARKVARLRARLSEAGIYGTRITVLLGDPRTAPLPPYFASLLVSEDPGAFGGRPGRALAEVVSHCLRPYGGVACLTLSDEDYAAFSEDLEDDDLSGISVRRADGLAVATRSGALPGSADWSHRGANAANTGASQDRFVQAPLARLWYDGSLRWIRTHNSTAVRVAGGRIVVHAGAKLYAVDVFTGRPLWQVDAPSSQPSDDTAVAADGAIYLTSGRTCVVIDAATGKRTRQFDLPTELSAPWSIVRADGESLIGVSSGTLVRVDRKTGEVAWSYETPKRIGALAVGGGKVFCADYVKPQSGKKPPDVTIRAVSRESGKELWQATGGVEIRYYRPSDPEEDDLLCSSNGVFRCRDGERVGNAAVSMIAGDRLISGGPEEVSILDPETGKEISEDLKWQRRGCTSLRGSANLLTTRYKGNAAYIDLCAGGMTSIWNVRAACSNNLFVADGVLSLPNLTGGCTCNYMPISQAFVPAVVIQR